MVSASGRGDGAHRCFPRRPDAATPYALLGLGDVALPSLLVSFLGRYGDARGERAWRLTATSAYAVGLLMAFAANEYWRAGQPALLYLVPATVGAGLCTALATGGRRGRRRAPRLQGARARVSETVAVTACRRGTN